MAVARFGTAVRPANGNSGDRHQRLGHAEQFTQLPSGGVLAAAAQPRGRQAVRGGRQVHVLRGGAHGCQQDLLVVGGVLVAPAVVVADRIRVDPAGVAEQQHDGQRVVQPVLLVDVREAPAVLHQPVSLPHEHIGHGQHVGSLRSDHEVPRLRIRARRRPPSGLADAAHHLGRQRLGRRLEAAHRSPQPQNLHQRLEPPLRQVVIGRRVVVWRSGSHDRNLPPVAKALSFGAERSSALRMGRGLASGTGWRGDRARGERCEP